MPNSRRRKFSVQHDNISGRNTSKSKAQSSGTYSYMEPHQKTHQHTTNEQIQITVKSTNTKKNKPNNSKNIPPSLDTIIESNSSLAVISDIKQDSKIIDPNANSKPTFKTSRFTSATSSTIDLIEFMADADSVMKNNDFYVPNIQKEMENKPVKLPNREAPRRDKHPHQHRVKVRSPKRPVLVPNNTQSDDQISSDCVSDLLSLQNMGTSAIDWEQELEECVINNVTQYLLEGVNEVEEDRRSNHSNEDMCRICHGADGLSNELGQLISACSCRGTVGRVHVKCLERWLTESGKSRCELCGTRYATLRVHRYGVPRALVMWVLSQNAKQLMVDSLGIMLMSPLAILAAWLSGRTLAGLMTQDANVTPWPLASTFVLACMTLVCYYCWIVSAATRHALAWWIWYRSQYEVRLQLQNTEE